MLLDRSSVHVSPFGKEHKSTNRLFKVAGQAPFAFEL